MLKRILLPFIVCFVVCVLSQKIAYGQESELKVVKIPGLEELLKEEPGKVKVINFWATWCKPCVKELPYFTAAEKEFKNIEFVYASLDFVQQKAKVESFAKKKGLALDQIYIIDELDYNLWIDKVSEDWSGAIPGTLIIDGVTNTRKFYEKEFHEGELTQLLTETTK
jgi:thiol-disulfide isomerase/thioredoxin